MTDLIDILVIGGGINGTALAADAAGRNLKIILCEKNDLGSGTSSASTKLIHGGLRYLEFFEFKLVKKALKEREILMKRAPNVIHPLKFVLPYENHLRPQWMIRLGLFIYDHLTKNNSLPSSKKIKLSDKQEGEALKKSFDVGFSHYDCFTDDTRLVLLNALLAEQKGATILTRTEFITASKEKNYWNCVLYDTQNQQKTFVKCKTIINATGPWLNEIHKRIEPEADPFRIKLDKGSHIIVPKLYEGSFAYLLQNNDKRIVFTIPYYENFTLIGTTDVPYTDSLEEVHISNEEVDYLLQLIQRYFRKTITEENIIHSYSGVRCLQHEPNTRAAKLTRDYKFVLNHNPPFLLTVIGGKLTTHRTLAEEAMELLLPVFPNMGSAWTQSHALPGCDFPNHDLLEFKNKLFADFSFLSPSLLNRYISQYGTLSYSLLNGVKKIEELGIAFSDQLYECEVRYLMNHEWARSAEDILWRRTKLGLISSNETQKKLSEWMKQAVHFN